MRQGGTDAEKPPGRDSPQEAATGAAMPSQTVLHAARMRVPMVAMPRLDAALRALSPFAAAMPPADALAFADRLAALDLPAVLRRQPLIPPHGAPRLAGLRLTPDPAALAGLAGGDRDLAAHARQVIGARLLQAMGDPAAARALLGGPARLPLLLDLTLAALGTLDPPDAPPAPGLAMPPILAVLPVADAADTAGLAAARAALAARGWGLALGGVTAEALALTVPALLPGDLLLAPFSPARAGAGAAGPARLVLTGCDAPEAVALAIRLGIPRIAGRLPDRLLAAARLAACASAPGCTAAACADRAAATGIAGRAGCGEPRRLASLAAA
jgi:hypothetical protein